MTPSLYSIVDHTSSAGAHTFRIVVDATHPAFAGHFPGQPVVPGVMTLMTLRELAETAYQLPPQRLAYLRDAKYLRPIIPNGDTLTATIALDAERNLKADIADQQGTLTKMRATLADRE